MAIDTVLLCFCEDCESNRGHPRYAPPLLSEAIGEHGKPAAVAADPYSSPAQQQVVGWSALPARQPR
jgi:hypothetical protein